MNKYPAGSEFLATSIKFREMLKQNRSNRQLLKAFDKAQLVAIAAGVELAQQSRSEASPAR